jgi:hypothetical protein
MEEISKLTYFETQQNSDQTEGRGPMVTVGTWGRLEDAVNDAQGRGVMGYGTGDVVQVDIKILGDDKVEVTRETVYGYRKGRTGRWGYGYIDLRDEPDDKDWETYLRLREKYERR